MPSLKRVFTLRLKDEYFDRLEVAAEKEHRSLTNLIELAVIRYLDDYETKGRIKENTKTTEIKQDAFSINLE